MARKPTMRQLPLVDTIPRIRCTPIMKNVLDEASEKYGTSVSNLVRVCVAHCFGITEEPALLEESSRAFAAVVRKAELSGTRPDSN